MVHELALHLNEYGAVTADEQSWGRMLEAPGVTVLLAFRDDEVLGYVSAVRRLRPWTGSDVLALDDLYVRKHARKAGVGAALMRELAGNYAAPDALTITWGVAPENVEAQKFYRGLGATLRPKWVAHWRPPEGGR